ncbi:MAG TPA: GNAT family N-acetyltransferase [Candidatus Angelobacter sp.]
MKITICRRPNEIIALRPLWDSLCDPRVSTTFQDFDLNLLAAETFAGREEPLVVCAEASYGAAIVPAAVRPCDGTLRLLGEEVFDYRSFLHQGDDEVLFSALAVLAELGMNLEVVALREPDCGRVPAGLPLFPFSAAPAVLRTQVTAAEFELRHTRLARNLRRLQRLGLELATYPGGDSRLLRTIYQNKATQDAESLFHDPVRVQFMVRAGMLKPERMEIFTLERGERIGAALVTLLDPGVRRFYTGWFAPELAAHSPALTLIYEVTRLSLAADLDCDYMTGEQPYKLRLATSSMPLYKLKAAAAQLAAAVSRTATVLGQAS